ncbi:MAG: hypothetical protein GW859_02840 [Sphingomonadales bacterium]|nr:hypothetical protein [Sphingomonadales bacterium]
MANTNSNPASARTGGPSISSTGAPSQQNQVDSQKGDDANATGKKPDEAPRNNPGDTRQHGGKQPSDPVQNRD